MKTLRLTLLAILVAGTARAQFFQRVYGTAFSHDILESGMNYNPVISPVTQRGYVMTGYTDFPPTAAPFNSVMVTRTNIGGVPFFNNAYRLSNPLGTVSAQGRKVLTLNNGQIAVWGDYALQAGGVSTRLFYMLLNQNGTVAFVATYTLSSDPVQIEATSITQSALNPANLYACGIATSASGQKTPVALGLVAATGAMNWSHEYADLTSNGLEWTAEDLIESPYPSPVAGTTDVAIVGRYRKSTAAPGLGAFVLIDAATGTVNSLLRLYGNAAGDAALNAITISNNPFGSGPGYVMSGYSISPSSTNPNFDSWALKTNPQGSIVNFSSLMDYSLGGRSDYSNDILERVNTSGQYEYYVGGYVVNGIFGRDDEVVYKLDFKGTPFPGLNQFTYGGAGNERVLQLDQYLTGAPANTVGLSMFNYTVGSFPGMLGLEDFYHVKAYFNGVTACNYSRQNFLFKPGPQLFDSLKTDTLNYFKQGALIATIAGLQDTTICIANAVIGGSNARLAVNGAEEMKANVFPNPVSQNNAVVQITFETPGDGSNIQVQLWNALGQLCLQKTQVLNEGESQLELNLGNGLSTGIYHLVLRRGNEVMDYKILVE